MGFLALEDFSQVEMGSRNLEALQKIQTCHCRTCIPLERLGSAVRRWPELVQDFSPVVDAVLWGLVTAIESVALFSMVCCFFLFCGCTL